MAIRILLACAGGFSTSLLMEKIKKAAVEKEIEIEIKAVSQGAVDKYIDGFDILLLGPQVRYMENHFKEKYQDKNVTIHTIISQDYGMMNGENVLNQALRDYFDSHN